MPEDYAAVVASAISDAGIQMDSSVTVEPSSDSGLTETIDTGVVVEPKVVADKMVEKPAVEDTRDAFTKYLEDEEGVKPPVEGQKKNYLPHDRVQKISKNAYERGKKEAAEQVAKLTKDLESSTSKFALYENADRLAGTDEVQFLKTLATLHPKFQRFLEPLKQQAEAVVEAKSAPDDDKADPKPEKKTFPDGSVGYDDAGVDELLAWNSRKTLRDAKSEFTKLLEPYKKLKEDRETQETLLAEIPKIKAESAKVREMWGDALVKEHQVAIAKAIDDHPDWTTSDAAASVLVPILNAQLAAEKTNTTKAREKVITDLNRRATAADSQDGRAPALAAGQAETDDSIQAAVAQSLREAGLMQ